MAQVTGKHKWQRCDAELVWGDVVMLNTYLVSFHALDSLFLFLFSDDDERASVLVECKTHI